MRSPATFASSTVTEKRMRETASLAAPLESVGEADAVVIAEHFERSGDKPRATSWYLRPVRVRSHQRSVLLVISKPLPVEVVNSKPATNLATGAPKSIGDVLDDSTVPGHERF